MGVNVYSYSIPFVRKVYFAVVSLLFTGKDGEVGAKLLYELPGYDCNRR